MPEFITTPTTTEERTIENITVTTVTHGGSFFEYSPEEIAEEIAKRDAELARTARPCGMQWYECAQEVASRDLPGMSACSLCE